MNVDCHVHVCASTPGHGSLSEELLRRITFRFLRWRFHLPGEPNAELERRVEALLVDTVAQTPELDAAVVLAFDAVHDRDGNLDAANTHLYVTNDYVIELVARYPKLLFGASVHPYRKD